MQTHKTPIITVINEWVDDTGLDQAVLDYDQLIRWATDVNTEFGSPEDQLKHKIVLLQTDKGSAKLPSDFKRIDQVAYRVKPSSREKDCTKIREVKGYIYEYCGSEIKVTEKEDCGDSCGEKMEIEVDFNFIKKNPKYFTNSSMMSAHTFDGSGVSQYHNKFKLMSYSGNSYFRLQHHVDSCDNLVCTDCEYKYVLNLPMIETDLPKNGELLISYLGVETDDDGNVMIPDEPNSIEAIKENLTFKFFRRKFITSKDKGEQFLYQEAEQRYEKALARARSVLDTPSQDEFRAFMSNVWLKRVRNVGPVKQSIPHDPYDTYLV